MASAVQQTEVSDLKKKPEEEEENPEESMDEDDENDEGEDGDGGDVEEDVVVEVGATYPCKRQDGTFHDAEILKTRMNKQAGREEFYVHYTGLNRRQNEWVDKTRLDIPKPEKDDAVVANGTGSDTAENGKTPQKRKNEEGDPEPKKAKVDSTPGGDFSEELTCLLCSELFKDPVMVECGHNFCRNCFDKAWSAEESFTCPDCKEVITEKRPTTNRALANLVKKAVGSNAADKPKPSENCLEHDERLKLYCKDDGTLSCVICRDSLKHASHTFLPILDAVGVYRKELSAIVAPLEEALKVTEQLTSQQGENVEQHKTSVSKCKQHILSEFEKLHEFLKERKEKLLEQLKEQGENLLKDMEANMVKLQENQDNIKETITMANERVNDSDSISFLTDIKSFIEKCQEQQKEVTSSGNSLLSKDLCQGTFRGPIQYSVLKQMKSFIVPNLTKMLLDPDSAHPNLVLADNMTSVKYGDAKRSLPDNPKRFSQCILVLGAQGFDSGRHYWEVEVGDKTAWDVGMASESSCPKGKIKLNPRNGYWAIWLRNGNAYKALESPSKTLVLNCKPKRIGVYVDYEGGQISFYNADDMSAIYTFKATFTDKLYPYLSPFLHDSGLNAQPLRFVHE